MKKRKSMKSKVQKDAKRARSGGGFISLPQGVEFFAAEPGGRVTLDILPYEVTIANHPDKDKIEVGDLWYKFPYRYHRNVGVNRNSEVCPRTFGKPCPICDHRDSLLNSKDPDKDEIYALKPAWRVLYNVRALTGKDKDKIVVWDFSYHNFQKQLDAEIDDPENDEYGAFADLENGYSLKIRFSEETYEKNKFAKTERIDFEKRDDLDESMLKEVVNLDKVLSVKSYEELKKKFFELDDEDLDEEGDNPKSSKKEEHVKTEEKTTSVSKEEDQGIPSKGDIDGMTRKELKQVVKKYCDQIDPDDYDETSELEKAVINALYPKSERKSKTTEKEEKVKEETKEKETLKETTKESKKEEGKSGSCPHGHKWGEADEHDACNDCDLWDDCLSAS